MGQGGSNPFREGGQIMSQYQVEEQNLEHMATYLTHKQNKNQYLLRELTFNEIREFTNTEQKLKRREKVTHPNLTNLIRMEQRTQDQMCSNFYKIYALWEYPRRSLMDEISLRALHKRPFQEQDLWRILGGTSDGMAALQSNDLRHQALSTKTILLDKDNNVKVADPSVLGFQSNLQAVYSNRHQKNLYLSPQQCEFIESNKPTINKNAFKNDVYTMGVIMLECATLERQDACYLDQCARINQAQVARRLTQVGNSYGERVRRAIEAMLGTDIRRRPDWAQLSQVIREQKVSSPRPNNVISNNNTTLTFSGHSPRVSQRPANEPQGNSYAGIPLGLPTIPSVSHEGGSTLYGHSTLSSPPQPAAQINQSTLSGTSGLHSPIMPVQSVYKSNHFAEAESKKTNHNQHPPPSFGGPQFSQTTPTPEFRTTAQIVPPPPAQLAPHSQTHTNPVQPVSSAPPPAPPVHTPQLQTLRSEPPPQTINFPSPQLQSVNSQPPHPFPNRVNPPPNQQNYPNEPQFVEQYFKMGSRYEGYKLNGLRHGFGKFFYQDGGRYEGDWKNNQMNGQGKLFYQSNKLAYDGSWLNDQFQGKGTLYNEEPVPLANNFDYRNFDEIEDYWEFYEGSFKEDLKSGRGLLKFSNGETFEGMFSQDMVEGQGTFQTRDGTLVRGVWSENQLVQYFT